MNTQIGLEQCRSFINCQMKPSSQQFEPSVDTGQKRAITISRQSGCGAHVIVERLIKILQEKTPSGQRPWTLFDRNLVKQVLEDHQLPKHLAAFMPEDRVSEMVNIMDELFGVHPSMWSLVEQTADTILRLADMGNVIILGRGANIITARLSHVTHVRIVSSPERRLWNMQQFEGLTQAEAAERIKREDGGRQRYVKKHFGKNVDDPLLYHVVINTDLVSFEAAARLIADLVLQHSTVASAP